MDFWLHILTNYQTIDLYIFCMGELFVKNWYKVVIFCAIVFLIIVLITINVIEEGKKEVIEESLSSDSADLNDTNSYKDETEVEETNADEVIEPSPKEQMFNDVVGLIDKGLAFDTGSYIKGDIPKGEYAFITFEGSGEYYSEEDASGDIIDNENFSSFGYVQVHEAGNIETRGVLVKVEALEELGVSGAKELYEIMNGIENYSDSGWYKVGVDIEPGEHIIESYGSGYVAIVSGPVGNYDIIKNDNFDGRYSVNLQEGQYLNISRATIVE